MKALVLENISKKLGRRQILKNISFEVEQGNITGFIGPNGAGKTTTIKMITGLINKDEGKLLLNGIDIKNKRMALQNVGSIVESPIFFPYMSGEENLRDLSFLNENMSKNEREEKIKEVISIVGLNGREKDKVKTYSLGMKQRLGIAQSLLNNPSLVILDEPTNGLDPLGIKELRELILKLNREKGITFFISSHYLNELEQICTDFVIINYGEIKWKGKKEKLISIKGKENLEEAFVSILGGENAENFNKDGVV